MRDDLWFNNHCELGVGRLEGLEFEWIFFEFRARAKKTHSGTT